jgi:hypothetical protein
VFSSSSIDLPPETHSGNAALSEPTSFTSSGVAFSSDQRVHVAKTFSTPGFSESVPPERKGRNKIRFFEEMGSVPVSLWTLLPYVHHLRSLEKVPQLIPLLLCIYFEHDRDPPKGLDSDNAIGSRCFAWAYKPAPCSPKQHVKQSVLTGGQG